MAHTSGTMTNAHFRDTRSCLSNLHIGNREVARVVRPPVAAVGRAHGRRRATGARRRRPPAPRCLRSQVTPSLDTATPGLCQQTNHHISMVVGSSSLVFGFDDPSITYRRERESQPVHSPIEPDDGAHGVDSGTGPAAAAVPHVPALLVVADVTAHDGAANAGPRPTRPACPRPKTSPACRCWSGLGCRDRAGAAVAAADALCLRM